MIMIVIIMLCQLLIFIHWTINSIFPVNCKPSRIISTINLKYKVKRKIVIFSRFNTFFDNENKINPIGFLRAIEDWR